MTLQVLSLISRLVRTMTCFLLVYLLFVFQNLKLAQSIFSSTGMTTQIFGSYRTFLLLVGAFGTRIIEHSSFTCRIYFYSWKKRKIIDTKCLVLLF